MNCSFTIGSFRGYCNGFLTKQTKVLLVFFCVEKFNKKLFCILYYTANNTEQYKLLVNLSTSKVCSSFANLLTKFSWRHILLQFPLSLSFHFLHNYAAICTSLFSFSLSILGRRNPSSGPSISNLNQCTCE